MTHKQILWLAGSSAVVLTALAGWSFFNRMHRPEPLAAAAVDSLSPVLYTLPAVDDGTEKPATISKRRTTVSGKSENAVEYNKLTPEEARVILRKGTERPFTGEYTLAKDPGTYICRRCNAPLYHRNTKFESHCGWPSFDDEIKGAVKHRRETDGTGRTEIVCANCGGHLGHVFFGEGFTAKNTRHCVNSVSMRFIAQGKPLPEVIKPKDAKRVEAKRDAVASGDGSATDAGLTPKSSAGASEKLK